MDTSGVLVGLVGDRTTELIRLRVYRDALVDDRDLSVSGGGDGGGCLGDESA